MKKPTYKDLIDELQKESVQAEARDSYISIDPKKMLAVLRERELYVKTLRLYEDVPLEIVDMKPNGVAKVTQGLMAENALMQGKKLLYSVWGS